mgnify:CR=1 FL=1
MGIVRIFPIDTDKEEYPYQCKCLNDIATVDDIISPHGECTIGKIFSFSDVHNTFFTRTVHLQLFAGDSLFIVDADPLPNYEVVAAREFHCKQCIQFMGWFVKSSDQYLCLRKHLY